MKSNQHKKGALAGIVFLFSVFAIIFMLIFFYIWVQKNISAGEERQAEIVASEIEMRAFFSELIQEKGTEIIKDNDKAEEAIEKFAEQKFPIKGGYYASCSTTGLLKECHLTAELHETLATVTQWGMYISAAAIPLTFGATTMPTLALVAFKHFANKDIKSAEYGTYLPANQKATEFKLKISVEYA